MSLFAVLFFPKFHKSVGEEVASGCIRLDATEILKLTRSRVVDPPPKEAIPKKYESIETHLCVSRINNFVHVES